MSQPTTPTPPEAQGLPEQILNLADALGEKVRTSLKQIDEINTQSSAVSLDNRLANVIWDDTGPGQQFA
jgi:hypothetical protein